MHEVGRAEALARVSVVNPLINYDDYIPILHSNPECLGIESLESLRSGAEKKEISHAT